MQTYDAPVTAICSSNTTPNTITITLTPYTAFTPTKYILKTYTNNVLTSTSSPTSYSPNQIVVNSGLSDLNVYSFQVQLLNDTQSSEFSIQNENIPVYPSGPTITGVSNSTSTTVQVNYTDYSTGGFDLSGATCIINTSGINYTNLTNTSVTLTGLTANTAYTTLTILFRKTINGFVISSSPSTVPTFTTNGIAPVVTSSTASSATNATIIFNNYSSGTSGEFNFTNAIVTAPGVTPSIVSITQPNTVSIGNLAAATTYNGCTLVLTASGATSDPITGFIIKTLSYGPTGLAQSSSTTTTITLTFTKPASLPGTIQTVYAYYGASQFSNVTLVNQGEIQLSGLYSGYTYNNVYITVSDGTYTSMPSNTVASISTVLAPAPTGITTTPGGNSVTIQYNPYTTPFTPTSGTLYDSNGNSLGTVSATSTQMTVTGLSPITTYTNSYIILTNGLNTSNRGNVPSFTPLEIPVLQTYAVNNNVSTQQVYITYTTFASFTPTGAGSTLHTNQGSFSGDATVTQPQVAMTFDGLAISQTYTGCYIILGDGTHVSAHSVGNTTGQTFTFVADDGRSGYL